MRTIAVDEAHEDVPPIGVRERARALVPLWREPALRGFHQRVGRAPRGELHPEDAVIGSVGAVVRRARRYRGRVGQVRSVGREERAAHLGLGQDLAHRAVGDGDEGRNLPIIDVAHAVPGEERQPGVLYNDIALTLM